MQRKVLLVIVCLLIINAALAIRSFVADALPAKASEVRQELRLLTIEERILLNQREPLWLAGIDLNHAFLRAVSLRGADLGDANLRAATLTDANLTGANLRRAIYNDATAWPAPFDPNTAGAILSE
jgi:uncharacterized protein YjbI with pentapeptide repeats